MKQRSHRELSESESLEVYSNHLTALRRMETKCMRYNNRIAKNQKAMMDAIQAISNDSHRLTLAQSALCRRHRKIEEFLREK